MRPEGTAQRRRPLSAVLSTSAVAALVGASVLIAAPANAAQTVTDYYYLSSQQDWVVPAGVTSISYYAVGGSGGSGLGEHGGVGGLGGTVAGTLAVTTGDTISVWAGLAGGDGGGNGGAPGAGGAGYTSGGAGASSGALARPGGGGGGSAAVAHNGSTIAIAGGGGAGGGRGRDDDVLPACYGGAGGDAGQAGSDAYGTLCNSTQLGGAAGADATLNGVDAVTSGFLLKPNLGGSGGGGGGAGQPGTTQQSGAVRNSGGGGGGGGASLVTGDGLVGVASVAGDGWVAITYDISYTTNTTLSVDNNNPVIGEVITFSSTVTNETTTDTPEGTVDFGVTGCNAQPLVAGPGAGQATATCDFHAGPVGPHAYHAVFNPTSNTPYETSQSSELGVLVDKGDTTTLLVIDPSAPVVGQDVTATATVSIDAPADAPLSGSVLFYRDGFFIGSSAVDPVTGSAALTFPSGDVDLYSIEAVYVGNDDLNGSNDFAQLDVQPGDTATTVALDPAQAVTGSTVKATATVVILDPAVTVLSGDVDFYRGAAYLGTAAVDPVSGQAVYEFPAGAIGNYDISAVYTGNDNLNGSTGEALLVVVAKPLPMTGTGQFTPIFVSGAIALLLLGGTLLAARRVLKPQA